MKRFSWLPLGLVVTLGFLLGMLGFSIWEKTPISVERVAWASEAQWIAPQSSTYRFYARHTFYLPDEAEAGWLRISADNDFTLYVNGRRVARENSVLNNSLGLRGGLRTPEENVNDSNNYHAKTSVNYLLASSKDWKLTGYVDLTQHLRPGKNVIALEIQKGKQNPRTVVEGTVYFGAGLTPINLTTGVANWRVSNLSETRQSLQWYDVDFTDASWLEARELGSIQEATYSRLSKNLFDRPLEGNWITGTLSQKGQVWFRGVWQIPQTPISHAYIRFAGRGRYSVLLNGSLVNNYITENGKQLHLLEITKLLRPGNNTLAVSLASPLEATLIENKVVDNGSINLFLDGWAETGKGEIISTTATDNTWRAFKQVASGWENGVGEGQVVTFLSLPKPQQFSRNFEGDAYLLNYPNYLLRHILWQLVGVICTLIYALNLGFCLGCKNRWDSLGVGAAVLTPATLFLAGITLLKHRYAEAEVGLLFAQPQSNYLILIGFISVFILTLLLSKIRNTLGDFPRWSLWFLFGVVASLALAIGGNPILIFVVASTIIIATILCIKKRWQIQDSYIALPKLLHSSGQWIVLGLIVGIGFALRTYNLDFIDLDTDENTSLDASRGILRTGAPIATSGIWYTRGPFYQFLLAAWLKIFGDSIVSARFLSVMAGTFVLALVYLFARKITGQIWIALFVTAILAISPWEIWYSRNIRFYQVLQFLTILSFWSFFKGFIDKAGRIYQHIFFIALTLTLLTQEISLTILPVFILGFLYFYRPFQLLKDMQILIGSLLTVLIFIYCLGFSSIKLLTPLAAISDSTASYLRLHFSDITELTANFFIGPDRMQTIYSLFFIMGLFYFIKHKSGENIYLSISIIVQVLIVTLISYQPDERYIYAIYPIFILQAIHSAIHITNSLTHQLNLMFQQLPLQRLALSIVILLLILNIQPVRVLFSYQESINKRNSQMFEYIMTHKQASDVVISPLPSLAVTNLGKIDYFLMGTGYFDAIYWNKDKLIDRWAGGQIITNPDQINHVLEKSKRVWIHLEESRKGRFNRHTWEYVETLGKPVIDSFGTRLRLWQPENGIPRLITNQGKDLGAY